MRRSVKDLVGYTIRGTDGELGEVEEFYFDDRQWKVRYLVVHTGGQPAGRRVLISTVALRKPDWTLRTFPVALTVDQVRNSPDIDTDKPVSRQQEAALRRHYAWPAYRGKRCAPVMVSPVSSPLTATTGGTDASGKRRKDDPHLRSTRRVMGYHIRATDGRIGHVDDFLFDDTKWTICYLVVETRNWLPGRKVLVPAGQVDRVSWAESTIFTALSRKSIESSPEFDILTAQLPL